MCETCACVIHTNLYTLSALVLSSYINICAGGGGGGGGGCMCFVVVSTCTRLVSTIIVVSACTSLLHVYHAFYLSFMLFSLLQLQPFLIIGSNKGHSHQTC